ncbi:MAG: MerR family transcriptional regulator [Bdellovibrionales bacterium GWA2_49_15]|nr:MAG: MerR family transcriptional regulator [Bdellovibrionales bacterium GWA2_49_15]HAZ14559.1 MerR family transcriptional regulator [Bdellovibrionales bacterium]
MEKVKSSSYSISQLASEFSLSTRTIRFYEEKGLIKPERGQGNQRTFGRRDRARLKLILRGKRFGMTLDQIVSILGRADLVIDEIEQIKQAILYGQQYMEKIQREKRELETMERELVEHGKKCLARLRELGCDKEVEGARV